MAEAVPAKSWASIASKVEDAGPLKVVQIDGLAIMKIVKHCKEAAPALVTGQLLGLDIGATLEVTNCFPFPSRASEEEEDGDEMDGANYQLEMMRCLREVNVDNNTVGWYQSTFMGSFQTLELIDTFLNYQENIKRCVCIIYDPNRSAQGILALKALRLSETFMEVYRSGNFTPDRIREKDVTWRAMFEEIPISVRNSALSGALMASIAPEAVARQDDFDRLSLSVNPFLEKSLEFLVECMDDLGMEQQKIAFHSRSVTRQQAQQLAFVQKRRVENAVRKQQGEEPLPEEDPTHPAFKPIPEPSRLEGFLITSQISNYCSQINQFSSQALGKLYAMQALRD